MKIQTKLHKKIARSTLFLVSLSISAFAQQKAPDTLIVNTKAGKILLISDSLQRFNNIATEALIKKSLFEVRDSLTETQREKAVRIWKERFTWIIPHKHNFRILPAAGIGTIRDKMSPFLALSLDFAPARQDYYLKKGGSYTFINLAIANFFTFEKNITSDYITNNDLFIEASIGNRLNNFHENFGRISEASAGIGYLAYKEGNYFNRNTFKIFASIGLYKSFIKIKPELYITNNFSKAFPGITLKFF